MANFLYNGVELPNIDSVWTDKETYPYAHIHNMPYMGAILLLTSSEVYAIDGNAAPVEDGSALWYVLPEGEATWVLEDESDYYVSDGYSFTALDFLAWTSNDILNTNNTVYLAASDPVPVGGDEGGDESTARKHYCRVNGSVYEVEGGTARISGSYHEIEVGTVRIDGAYYEIPFSGGDGGEGGSFDGWLLKDGEALVEFAKVSLNPSNNAAMDNSNISWQDGYVQLKLGSFTATVPNPAGGTMETAIPIHPFLVSAYAIDMSKWSTLHFVYRGYAQFGYGSLTGIYNAPIKWTQSNYKNNSGSYVEETIDLEAGASGHIAIGYYSVAGGNTMHVTDIWLT